MVVGKIECLSKTSHRGQVSQCQSCMDDTVLALALLQTVCCVFFAPE